MSVSEQYTIIMKHSAILLTCIKRLSVLKPYFGSSFEWPLKTGFTLSILLVQLFTPPPAENTQYPFNIVDDLIEK